MKKAIIIISAFLLTGCATVKEVRLLKAEVQKLKKDLDETKFKNKALGRVLYSYCYEIRLSMQYYDAKRYGKSLRTMNKAIRRLEKTGYRKRPFCGELGRCSRCYGLSRMFRAYIYAKLGMPVNAIKDLYWLHRNKYGLNSLRIREKSLSWLLYLVKYKGWEFWKYKDLKSLRPYPSFRRLASYYKNCYT